MCEAGVWLPEIDRVSERMLLPGVEEEPAHHIRVMGKSWLQHVVELRVQSHTDTGGPRFDLHECLRKTTSP